MIATVAYAQSPATTVRNVLSSEYNQLDYLEAKLVFDKIIDPTIDEEKLQAQLNSMVAHVRATAGPSPGSIDVLKAVRKTIYEPGKGNDLPPK